MDAKWNWAIDSLPVRLAALVAAFGVWFGAAYAIMEVAARG